MSDNHSNQTNEYGQLLRQIRSHQADSTGPYTEDKVSAACLRR